MSQTAAPLTLRRSLALVWRSLRSMRTALILLLLLALASIAGSLVPQIPNSPLRVAAMFREHPLRARIYDALGLFDVYSSWWFSLITTLLLVSLAACLIPRTRAMVRNLRARPQPIRELETLRHYREVPVAGTPAAAIARARSVLRRRLFRVAVTDGMLAADKGLAREGGSLLFHWSFFLLLVGAIVGKGTGFTGFAAISEGQCWVDAAANYDGNLRAGRYFNGDHTGARICVRDFADRFRSTGQPMDFVTAATLRSAAGGPARDVEIRVNEPASIDGIRLYQYAFGWAPTIEIRDAGRRIASGPVQFERDPVPEGLGELQVPWHGAIRLPTTDPQIGIQFQLWPDSRAFFELARTGRLPAMTQVFQPVMRYRVYEGDLDAEIRPSFARLDTTALREVASGIIGSGQTIDLERGSVVEPGERPRAGARDGISMTFSGLRQYTVLQVARDRGVWIVLAAAILILLGLVPALYTSRRRLWARAEPDGRGSLLKVGGYALQRTTQFEEEFARLVDRLAAGDPPNAGAAEAAGDPPHGGSREGIGGSAADAGAPPLDGSETAERRPGAPGDGERSQKVGSR
jgi:cytochrome c biogenesis protein